MAMSPANSGIFSRSFWYHNSHCDLVLVNIKVDLLFFMIGINCGVRFVPKCPLQGICFISFGAIDLTCIFFLMLDFINTPLFSFLIFPNKTSFACSIFPIVADIPQTEVFELKCLIAAKHNST